jgi:hypothetical protein
MLSWSQYGLRGGHNKSTTCLPQTTHSRRHVTQRNTNPPMLSWSQYGLGGHNTRKRNSTKPNVTQQRTTTQHFAPPSPPAQAHRSRPHAVVFFSGIENRPDGHDTTLRSWGWDVTMVDPLQRNHNVPAADHTLTTTRNTTKHKPPHAVLVPVRAGGSQHTKTKLNETQRNTTTNHHTTLCPSLAPGAGTPLPAPRGRVLLRD